MNFSIFSSRSSDFYPVLISCSPWTLANWAPMSFLGVEVNRLSGKTTTALADAQEYELDSRGSSDDDDAPLQLLHGSEASSITETSPSTGELSGIYFGILNIFTTLPQFVGTFLSSVIFSILDPGRSPELTDDGNDRVQEQSGPNAIAVLLFIGAVSSLGAAYVTRSLRYL
jgi:solute carrier family 45, member 1/2/4